MQNPLFSVFFMSPRQMAIFIIFSSLVALSGALIGQYGFDLHPCDLCIYQRIPFIINMILGLLAYFWMSNNKLLIGLSGFVFFVNSAIALFHSGVERKWWTGLTGCSTPDMSGTVEELLKRIQETAVVRCDEIPWSFMGLSMANYNVVFCGVLGIICLRFAFLNWQSQSNG